jgi:D-serine deaminase-like pyridoxal phosphate-dependent protein
MLNTAASFPPPAEAGSDLASVDTPALLLDLDAFERNLDRLQATLAGSPVRVRPHAKAHKCVEIALRQIARGAVGVCCQKVSEAEAFVRGGIRDVFVVNEIVGTPKLARLARLAEAATIGVTVDDEGNADAVDRAAREAGVSLDVLVEIDVGLNRCGVEPGPKAVSLARRVAAKKHLRFAGLQAYQGRAQHVRSFEERRAAAAAAADKIGSTVDLLAAEGLRPGTVTGGGTGTYPFDAASGVYTEIQPGSYVFMDKDYGQNAWDGLPRFEQSLFCLTTVMSTPDATRFVVDAGHKATSIDSGLPDVHGRKHLEYLHASDEHGTMVAAGGDRPRIGDRLRLVPGHCDPTVNLHDWLVGVRGGVVETVWPVSARGAGA